MNDNQQVRKLVFSQELSKLKQHQLITEEDYNKVSYAHNRYYKEVEGKKPSEQRAPIIPQSTPQQTFSSPKPLKVLSPQEIRDRNISWILIIGVVLVLMSGLILSTSTWAMMNNAFKTVLISLVAGLFFGISIVAGKVLKIEKTSFAFWVLGSLFLPVAILSAGYFELFGHYLSIFGDGKYILGVIGASVCLPVYLYSAKKYSNRLFVWIGLITLSSDVGFLLASMNLKIDLFYFGIVLYNGLILYAYNKLKSKENFSLFTKEVPIFAQANLILSTILMLSFYDNVLLYGFNILLVAVLYILMVFSQGNKEYIYVFSALVVYGIYQVTENSFLSNVDLIVFSAIGILFVPLERYLKRDEAIQKVFLYTNAIISALAFLYISLQGIFIRMEQASWVLFFAYIIIACNYLYLANRTKRKLFAYLTPIFLISAAYQFYRLIQANVTMNLESIVMFDIGAVMFALLYYKNKVNYLQIIKESSLLGALVLMLWGIASGIRGGQAILVSLEFIVLGITSYLIYRSEINNKIRSFCKYAVPSTWFIGVLILCVKANRKLNETGYQIEGTYVLLIAILLIFALGYLWNMCDNTLTKPFFYVGHIVLPCVIILVLADDKSNTYTLISILMIYIYSMIKSLNEWKTKVFLYASYTTGVVTLYLLLQTISKAIEPPLRYTLTEYALSIGAVLIGAIWLIINENWKERTSYYLIPFNMFALYILSGYMYPFEYLALVLLITGVGMEIYLLHRYKLQILQILPLWSLVVGLDEFIGSNLEPSGYGTVAILIVFVIGIKFLGELLSSRLYGKDIEGNLIPIHFDWFVVVALVLTLKVDHITSIQYKYSVIGELMAPVLIVYIVFSQIKRVPKGLPASIVKSVAAFSLLIPYYTFVGRLFKAFHEYEIFRLIETEIHVLPWIALVIILSKRVWSGYEHITQKVEWAVLLIVALILFQDLSGINQLKEGLILGGLSLVSIIGGMQFKKKSFFFIGSGVLLLNMIVQTRDFWGNLPWWIYLLVTGMILIGTASLNEIQKNKKVIKIDKQAVLDKFKDWN